MLDDARSAAVCDRSRGYRPAVDAADQVLEHRVDAQSAPALFPTVRAFLTAT